jgi:hypothetical protein
MLDLSSIVARAAARVPGPVAARSLAEAALVRRYVPIDVTITDPDPTLGLLRVAPGERWCHKCGETINDHGLCPRCGGRRGSPAAAVLRPDEYFVAR